MEEETNEANKQCDQADCDIRDFGKKVHSFEIAFEETLDKVNKANEGFEEKDKLHREEESNISALTRRIMLMEEEAKQKPDNTCKHCHQTCYVFKGSR